MLIRVDFDTYTQDLICCNASKVSYIAQNVRHLHVLFPHILYDWWQHLFASMWLQLLIFNLTWASHMRVINPYTIYVWHCICIQGHFLRLTELLCACNVSRSGFICKGTVARNRTDYNASSSHTKTMGMAFRVQTENLTSIISLWTQHQTWLTFRVLLTWLEVRVYHQTHKGWNVPEIQSHVTIEISPQP